MLSKRYHLLYWVLSFAFLQAQPLRRLLKEHQSVEDDAQAIFEYAIALYALWFCLHLIEQRTRKPPAPPNWQMQRPVSKMIWESAFGAVVGAVVERRAWAFELGTGLMCLVVGDGALWASGVWEEGEDGVKGKIVRVFATFMFLGMVEPIWREKPDREASGLEVLSRTASQTGALDVLKALTTTVSVILAVAITAEVAIFAWTGERLSVLEWWFPVTMKPHRVVVMLWLLSPFTDLAETIFYCVYKN